ncbi:MAG TPA: CheR family methyltransferase [Pseudomonadales bacterium]
MLPTSPERFQHLTFLGDRPVPDAAPARGGDDPPAGPAPVDAASAALFASICQRWGLSAHRYRTSVFLRRQAACLRALRVATPDEGLHAVRLNPAASERALGALMIGVTQFFRDPEVFDALQGRVWTLRRGAGPPRVLSIGCSDGSELYSIAILMAEAGILDGSRLHGIDCRPAAIDAARAGVFPRSAIQALAPAWRARYFAPVRPELRRRPLTGAAAMVQVVDRLRDVCLWHREDAFAGTGVEGAFDLILCRNLAIYLTEEAAAELWSDWVERLRPGGLLVTGKAERPPHHIRTRLRRLGASLYAKEHR